MRVENLFFCKIKKEFCEMKNVRVDCLPSKLIYYQLTTTVRKDMAGIGIGIALIVLGLVCKAIQKGL